MVDHTLEALRSCLNAEADVAAPSVGHQDEQLVVDAAGPRALRPNLNKRVLAALYAPFTCERAPCNSGAGYRIAGRGAD